MVYSYFGLDLAGTGLSQWANFDPRTCLELNHEFSERLVPLCLPLPHDSIHLGGLCRMEETWKLCWTEA